MTIEDHDPNLEAEVYDQEVDHELHEILAEYRKRRLFEMLVGPVISLVFHVILFVVLVIVMVPESIEEPDELVVQMEELEVKEIEQEELEELEELEEEVEEVEEYEEPIEEMEIADTLTETDDMPEDMPEVEEDLALDEMSEIKAIESPLVMNALYGARTGAGKGQALGKYGGRYAAHTQRAVKSTLRWFKQNQDSEGFWPKGGSPDKGADHTHSMTGLALLAYLANGVTPADEEFGETVEKAVNWLSNNVDMETGLIQPGVIGPNYLAYENAIVAYAISEAYGMTKIGSLKPIMNRMVEAIIEAQREDGTWAYRYAKDSGHSDLSLAGWHLQALKAAYASGCTVDGMEKATQRGAEMIIAAILDNGTAYYQPAHKKGARPSLGPVGALCMQLLGEGKHERVSKVFSRIKSDFTNSLKDPDSGIFSYSSPKVKARSKSDWQVLVYDWYYQTQVVFQRGDMSFWRIWNDKFLYGQLTRSQIKKETDDGEVGYWDWPGREVGGWKRNYSTALNCLSLEVYYRNLPTFKKPTKKKEKVESVEATLFGDEGDDDIF